MQLDIGIHKDSPKRTSVHRSQKSGRNHVGSGEGTPEEEEAIENAETGHAKWSENRRRLNCKGPQQKKQTGYWANYKALFFNLIFKIKNLIVYVHDHRWHDLAYVCQRTTSRSYFSLPPAWIPVLVNSGHQASMWSLMSLLCFHGSSGAVQANLHIDPQC